MIVTGSTITTQSENQDRIVLFNTLLTVTFSTTSSLFLEFRT